MNAEHPDPVITIDARAIRELDLSPLQPWMEQSLPERLQAGAVVELHYQWPRDAEDPRELSECPEPRLWALRADAHHPWLPLLLERSAGSLAQHVAMLVPHNFSPSEGIRFDPQALELWVTQRLMLLDHLSHGQAQSQRRNLDQMAASLGYELSPEFWALLDQHPPQGQAKAS
ncbi:MAG: CRR6 family NdhI maturation factor [Synechococcus sp.]